jgi:hypothetical protein
MRCWTLDTSFGLERSPVLEEEAGQEPEPGYFCADGRLN